MDKLSDEEKNSVETFPNLAALKSCSSNNIKVLIQDKNTLLSFEAEEKILLEESTLTKLPKYVENIFNVFLEQDQRNEAEILLALIYCISLESGFAVEDCQDRNINKSVPSPIFYGSTFNKKLTEIYSHKFPHTFKDEKNQNFFKFNLTLINYSKKKCILIAIRTGEYLITTLTNNDEAGYSWCLSIPRYVLSRRFTSKNMPSQFRNLPELSMLMKEHIFGPVRNCILAGTNNLFPGLTGLPVELSNLILVNLNLREVQNLSKTCWKLRCICVDHFESKYKPKNKPFGSKHTLLSNSSSASFFRNFF